MEAIKPNCERLRPLAEYCDRLPSSRPGKRLNRATLWRWALSGLRGRRLRTVELGGGRMTCDAWVWQFVSGPAHFERVGAESLGQEERERIARALGVERSRRPA